MHLNGCESVQASYSLLQSAPTSVRFFSLFASKKCYGVCLCAVALITHFIEGETLARVIAGSPQGFDFAAAIRTAYCIASEFDPPHCCLFRVTLVHPCLVRADVLAFLHAEDSGWHKRGDDDESKDEENNKSRQVWVYRDLKPENVRVRKSLIDGRFTIFDDDCIVVRLFDFSRADRCVGWLDRSVTLAWRASTKGPLSWAARPTWLQRTCIKTTSKRPRSAHALVRVSQLMSQLIAQQGDVWAFGCLVLAMLKCSPDEFAEFPRGYLEERTATVKVPFAAGSCVRLHHGGTPLLCRNIVNTTSLWSSCCWVALTRRRKAGTVASLVAVRPCHTFVCLRVLHVLRVGSRSPT
jgi:serine/threonine protein kinase